VQALFAYSTQNIQGVFDNGKNGCGKNEYGSSDMQNIRLRIAAKIDTIHVAHVCADGGAAGEPADRGA
jgi:hypothetical protein